MRIFMRTLMLFLVMLIATSSVQAQSTELLLEYGRGLPRYVLWSPEGDQLLVVTQTGTLWRYDARTFETIDSVPGISWARYSTSGEWLFTQGDDQVWSIRRAAIPSQVIATDFTFVWSEPGNRWVMTRDASGVAVRPEATPEQVALEGLADVYFSPDQRHILTRDPVDGYVLRDYDLKPVPDQPNFPAEAFGVHWSPNGERLAMINGTDEVRIVPLFDDDQPETLTLPDRERYAALTWSPDNTRLLDYDNAGNARIWDVESGNLLVDLTSGETYRTPEELELYPPEGPSIWFLYWSTDGSHLFRCHTGGSIDVECRFYNGQTGAETRRGFDDSQWALDFSPDRRYMVLTSGVFNASTGEVIEDFSETRLGGYSRIFSADSRRVAMASFWNNRIVLFDLERMQVDHTLTPSPYLYDPHSMAWSPDGNRLVTWGSYGINGAPGSGLITVWDANSGREVARITDHVLFGQEMAFSSDSFRLAAADNLGRVGIFDLLSGNLLHTFGEHSEQVSMMAWQPNGDLLATTTGRSTILEFVNTPPLDGTLVHIWNTRTGTLVTTLEHENIVLAMLWHPSGRYLITDDNTGMSLWDAETGEQTIDPRMSGGWYTPNYRWADENVVIRGHHNCTHGGGDSLDFYNFETDQHVGPIHCSAGHSYQWHDAANGILLPRLEYGTFTSETNASYFSIDVALISTELPNELYESQTLWEISPIYSFGQFEQEPYLLRSPDNSLVAVVTDTELQMWRIGANAASLLWTGEPAQQGKWDNRGDELALIRGNEIHIVTANTGDAQAIYSELPSLDSYSISWSLDDRHLLLVSSDQEQQWVIDAASGEQISLPVDTQAVQWVYDFLLIYHPEQNIREWLDVHSGEVIAASDQIPTVISTDYRLGAETRTSVLRVWRFGE